MPVAITNIEEFQAIQATASNSDAVYDLLNDIDGRVSKWWNGGDGFTMIGTPPQFALTGTLNGNGYRVLGITVNTPTTEHAAVFRRIDGTVNDLGLEGVDIAGRARVGGFASWIRHSGRVNRCYVSGDIKVNPGSSFTIAGGFASFPLETSIIEDCYSLVTVDDTAVTDTDLTIQIGSFIGRLAEGSPILRRCFCASQLLGTVSRNFIGRYLEGSLVDCFYNEDVTGGLAPADSAPTALNNTTSRQFGSFHPEFDIATELSGENSVWVILHDKDYPRHRWNQPRPIFIYTEEQLDFVRERLWSDYWLVNNLDFSTWGSFEIIGSASTPYTGEFYGGQRAIADMTINEETEAYVGLFAAVDEGAAVTWLGMVDCDIKGDHRVGPITGRLFGTAHRCYSTGTVTGRERVGGIAGSGPTTGVIHQCKTHATISGELRVGGIVGGYNGLITECYSHGTVTANVDIGEGNRVGGIVGDQSTGALINCYSRSDVIAHLNGGTFAGFTYQSFINRCYTEGQLTTAGGSSGFIGAQPESFTLDALNSFVKDTSILDANENKYATSKTVEEMLEFKTYSSTQTQGLESAWDIVPEVNKVHIWGMVHTINDGFPFLQWDQETDFIAFSEMQLDTSITLTAIPIVDISSISEFETDTKALVTYKIDMHAQGELVFDARANLDIPFDLSISSIGELSSLFFFNKHVLRRIRQVHCFTSAPRHEVNLYISGNRQVNLRRRPNVILYQESTQDIAIKVPRAEPGELEGAEFYFTLSEQIKSPAIFTFTTADHVSVNDKEVAVHIPVSFLKPLTGMYYAQLRMVKDDIHTIMLKEQAQIVPTHPSPEL